MNKNQSDAVADADFHLKCAAPDDAPTVTAGTPLETKPVFKYGRIVGQQLMTKPRPAGAIAERRIVAENDGPRRRASDAFPVLPTDPAK